MIIMEKILKTILWAARLFDMYQQPQSKFDYMEHPTQKSDTN